MISQRTMNRRKRQSAYRHKFRSLASLLDAQPKGLLRDSRHRLLWDYYMSSDTLQKLRISPLCYHLLNDAEVSSENLADFYVRFKLPPHPFFPLFLAVKSKWLEERQRLRDQRDKEIFERIKTLPEHRRRALRILAEYERLHNPADDNPVWENRLYPKTKKRAEEMLRYNEHQWFETWQNHLVRLSQRYRNIPPLRNQDGQPTFSARILAVLVLRCQKISRKEIAQNFRRLSKEYHPDHGGQSELFRRIKSARDTLVSKDLPLRGTHRR